MPNRWGTREDRYTPAERRAILARDGYTCQSPSTADATDSRDDRRSPHPAVAAAAGRRPRPRSRTSSMPTVPRPQDQGGDRGRRPGIMGTTESAPKLPQKKSTQASG